jgi:hypothetical protein
LESSYGGQIKFEARLNLAIRGPLSEPCAQTCRLYWKKVLRIRTATATAKNSPPLFRVEDRLSRKEVGLLEVEHRILVFYRSTLICVL